MKRDIEKDLIEIECAIKSQMEKDNMFTVSVLQRCHKLVSELKEYKDLEKQGKLLKLPSAIGDEIFFVFMDCPKDYKKEYCRDHEGSCENCCHRVAEIVSRDFRLTDIPNMDKIFRPGKKQKSHWQNCKLNKWRFRDGIQYKTLTLF